MIHPNVPGDSQALTSRLSLSFLAQRNLRKTDRPRSAFLLRPRVHSAGELSLRSYCFYPGWGCMYKWKPACFTSS